MTTQTITITIPNNILKNYTKPQQVYPDIKDISDIKITLNSKQICQLLDILEPIADQNDNVYQLLDQIFN